MKLKLRTQFAILTIAVTLFPIAFGLWFFTSQQAKRDPRQPTQLFLSEVASLWSQNQNLTFADIREAGERAGLPIIDAALIDPEGTVLVSSFKGLPAGSKLQVADLARSPLVSAGKPRPELRFLPVDSSVTKSPLLLFDIQPFWTREDIRNKNFMLISSFALGAFLVAGLMSLLILRSTNTAIKNLIDDTTTVASGKLDHEVKGSGAEELRSLADSINRMRITLRDMISRRMNMLIGVSHDLKTPIALIQGYTDALADNMASDEITRQHYLEIIREKSAQLEDLVSDLIEFMKIDDLNMPMETVDLGSFVLTLGKRFEEDARLLGMEFVYGFGSSFSKEPPGDLLSDAAMRGVQYGAAASDTKQVGAAAMRIKMNRMLVERAIENLVSNAFRYTGRGGNAFRYTGRGGRVEFSLQFDSGQPVLVVADNGPGIPEEELPYVFDAFYRGTHSRQEAGHGLGLTIVKSIVDLHGWEIEAHNRIDWADRTAENAGIGDAGTSTASHGLLVAIRMKATL
jgi:signal transduction histidine kinase